MNAEASSTTKLQTVFRWLLGVMLLFTGTGHLTWARSEFLAQVPRWVPMSGDLVVVLSGIVELLLGASLVLLGNYRIQLGWIIAAFFLAVFPGNISQFTHHLSAFGLNSDAARGIRLLFQPVLVVWALWCTGAWESRRHITVG